MPANPGKPLTGPAKLNLTEVYRSYKEDGTLGIGIEFFESFVTRNPSNGLAWNLLARLQEMKGNFDEAHSAFIESAAVTEKDSKTSFEGKATRYLDVVHFCLRRGWLDRAQQNLNEAVRLSPSNPVAPHLQRRIDAATNSVPPAPLTATTSRAKETIRSRDNGLPTSNDYVQLIKTRDASAQGDIDLSQGRIEATGKPLTSGTKPTKSPKVNLEAVYKSHVAHGTLEQGVEFFESFVAEHPLRRFAWVLLGRLWEMLGDFEKAYFAINEVALITKQDPSASTAAKMEVFLGTARFCLKHGWVSRAQQSLDVALRLAPSAPEVKKVRRMLSAAKTQPATDPTHPPSPTSMASATLAKAHDAFSKGDGAPVVQAIPVDTSSGADDDTRGWGDEDEEPVQSITEMLITDRNRLDWTDATILSRGGIATLEDANRLMTRAATVSGDFNLKAALFLEAAKAYSALPISESVSDQMEAALESFARAKGTFFLLQLLGEAKKPPQLQTGRITRFRDTACAYYIEAMKILQRRRPGVLMRILRRYLQALIIAAVGPGMSDQTYESGLLGLLEFSGRPNRSPDLLPTVARGLLELGRTDLRLVSKAYDEPMVRKAILSHRGRWKTVLTTLGADEGPESLPRSMRSIIACWKNNSRKAVNSFSDIINYPITLSNIGDLRQGLDELTAYEGVFCDTDLSVLREIIADVLKPLVSYNELPVEAGAERNLVATRVRTAITTLRSGIRDYPTYWTRVMFDPMLSRWGKLLGQAEHARLAEVRPVLSARLESKRVPISSNPVPLVFSISNAGQATASNCVFELHIEDSPVVSCNLGSIQPGHSATAQIDISTPSWALKQKYFGVKRRISNERPDGREFSSWLEDVVQVGDFVPIERNPFSDGPPVDDPSMFKGREQIMGQILRTLQSDDRVRSMLLYGITRTGKTSILNQLKRKTSLMTLQIGRPPVEFRVLPLPISFAKCVRDSVDDFFLALFTTISNELDLLAANNPNCSFPVIDPSHLRHSLTGLEDVIYCLFNNRYYPLFLIDEFSFYRTLFDKGVLDATFLSRIRHFALDERKATFVFAGTYDLKKLTSDPAYGITGQLASTDQIQVGKISDQAARELGLTTRS